ncbi:MAG: thioredoxin family protein, partial [Balneolales bacterium]|nr:thioredoxin family protein [Balneolales bacterium]
MNKLKIGLLGLATVVLVAASSFNTEELEIGSKAPMLDHAMQDVSGRSLSMGDIAGENGLLVVFSCNTCPWVKKWED